VLGDNFVAIEAISEHRVVRFHNPSVRDFAHGLLEENPEIYFQLLDSAVYFDQVLLLASYGGLSVAGTAPSDDTQTFPGIALALSTRPDSVVSALERTLGAPISGVGVHRSGHLRWIGNGEDYSPEARARIALSAIRKLALSVPNWLSRYIEALQDRWGRGLASKAEALELLRELDLVSPLTGEGLEEARLAKWFASTLDDPEDYAALREFKLLRPWLLTDEEFEELAEEVGDVLANAYFYVVENSSSAGELERRVHDLSSIADDYGLALEEYVEWSVYEDQFAELAQIEDWQEEGAEEDWRDERYAERAEDAAIDALFETLGE
jgi:hypothetical protein